MNAYLQLYFDEIFVYAQDQKEPLCINLFEENSNIRPAGYSLDFKVSSHLDNLYL